MDAFIIGELNLQNTTIVSKGNNNIIFVNSKKPVTVSDSKIIFEGSNSLLFLNESNEDLRMKAFLHNDSVLYIGKNASFHKKSDLHLICGERKHIFIGDDTLFSTGIWLRTSDAHPIYNIETTERINPSKSIIIGDHVWIGQGALILKGTIVGSGAIIAAKALTSSNVFYSNSVYGGVPAKLIGQEGTACFCKRDVNLITVDENNYKDSINDGVFVKTKNSLSFYNRLINFLEINHSTEESIEFFKHLSTDKNRLCIKST